MNDLNNKNTKCNNTKEVVYSNNLKINKFENKEKERNENDNIKWKNPYVFGDNNSAYNYSITSKASGGFFKDNKTNNLNQFDELNKHKYKFNFPAKLHLVNESNNDSPNKNSKNNNNFGSYINGDFNNNVSKDKNNSNKYHHMNEIDQIAEINVNFDDSACQSDIDNEENDMQMISSNKKSTSGENDEKNNKKINNMNLRFNHTQNQKFSKLNFGKKLNNFNNKNSKFKKTHENFTSTENYQKLFSELSNDEKFLKIDYNKPEKSTNDILSYIIKTNKIKEKTMDPLLNNQRFLIHSLQNFSKIKNKFFQDTKNKFFKKGLENSNNILFTTNTPNNFINSSNNLNVITNNDKCCPPNPNSNENLLNREGYENGNYELPVPSIFKVRSTSYFKFFKKNKF